MNAPDAESVQHFDRRAWVLLHAEAQARGFKNALSFRRWCRRHGIPVYKDGKMLWVKRCAVDERLDELASSPSTKSTAVSDAVAALTGRRG